MFDIITYPKISCLLVTAKNRFQFLRKSIQCYLDQTYPNKELVIVNEGPTSYQKEIEDYVLKINRLDIRLIWLNGDYSLGSLRNISMGVADGEYFCQWDDDDFCLPNRLMCQYIYLTKFPDAKTCFLADQLQYFFNSQELYWNDWKRYGSGNLFEYSLIPGTILSKNEIGVKYPSDGKHCKAGEDSVFANRLIEKNSKSIILMQGMGLMHVYTHHGVNVYDLEHHKMIYKTRSHHYDFMLQNRARISEVLDYFKLAPEVKVMSREGLVFIYKNKNVTSS